MIATRGESGALIFKEGDDDVQEQSFSTFLKGASYLGMKLALVVGVVFLMISVSSKSTTSLRATSKEASFSASSDAEELAVYKLKLEASEAKLGAYEMKYGELSTVEEEIAELTELSEQYGTVATYLGQAYVLSVFGYQGVSLSGPVTVTYMQADASGLIASSVSSVLTGTSGTVKNMDTSTSSTTSFYYGVSSGISKIIAMTSKASLTSMNSVTLTPGVYSLKTGIVVSGTITLDCQNSMTCSFFFVCATTLEFAANTKVVYTNAQYTPSTYWYAPAGVAINSGVELRGNVLSKYDIVAYNPKFTGRLMSLTKVSFPQSSTTTISAIY